MHYEEEKKSSMPSDKLRMDSKWIKVGKRENTEEKKMKDRKILICVQY